MARKRVFTKMVSNDSESFPAIRVTFKGKFQSDYFSLAKIGSENFDGMNQTALSRLVLHEFVKNFQMLKRTGQDDRISQLQLNLSVEDSKPKSPKKRGTK